MIEVIRRAWRKYIESIPPPEAEPPPVSDAAILREIHPPAPAAHQQAFAELAREIAAHLPQTQADRAIAQLTRKLRQPTAKPGEVLVGWLASRAGKGQPNFGFIAVDWKAREEITCQAERLARAHGVAGRWTYDAASDTSWQGWQARGESPVTAPLRDLRAWLAAEGLPLFILEHDDTVGAFAVQTAQALRVSALCDQLGVQRVG